MNAAGNIPVDLLLLGMIAAFLVLRLRSILGRRTGFEGAPAASGPKRGPAPVIDGHAEVPPPQPGRLLPDPQSPAGLAFADMQRVSRRFDPAQFLTGAEGAFRMIVTAFAAGDRKTLRPLLSDATFGAFDQAIAAREAAGDTQRTDIRAITEVAIEAASLAGTTAHITVRFLSSQLNQTVAKDNSLVGGTASPADHIDIWTFERDLSQANPAWRLAEAQSA